MADTKTAAQVIEEHRALGYFFMADRVKSFALDMGKGPAVLCLHGPNGKYAGSYTDSALNWWVDRCLEWQQQGLEVYTYFDNDEAAYAVFNARRMQELLVERTSDF